MRCEERQTRKKRGGQRRSRQCRQVRGENWGNRGGEEGDETVGNNRGRKKEKKWGGKSAEKRKNEIVAPKEVPIFLKTELPRQKFFKKKKKKTKTFISQKKNGGRSWP